MSSGKDRSGSKEGSGDSLSSLSRPGASNAGKGGGHRGPDHDAKSEQMFQTVVHLNNRASLMRFLVVLVMAVLVAASVPPAMAAATANTFLFIAAISFFAIGMIAGERALSPWLTRIDVGTWLMALSFLAAGFVDPVAMEQAMQAAEAG